MLSELGKETVTGETSGSPCYQLFKFIVLTAVSHYIHKTGALFISLLNGISHVKSDRNDLAGPVSIGRFSAVNE